MSFQEPGTKSPRRRCGIYTRKSTSAGLSQEVNLLEAQREVCSAYIKGQAHRNWSELSQHYDDAQSRVTDR
jgi:hypothetical protein